MGRVSTRTREVPGRTLLRHPATHAVLAVDDGDTVRLVGSRCPACGAVAFPGRLVCAECGARDLDAHALSGTGTVHAATRLDTPPAGFEPPIVVAVVDLDEGPRTFALLAGPDAPPAGTRVVAVSGPLRDSGDGPVPGYRFAVAEA